MPAVNDVGEPCAGEPHARFDGRGLETERPGQGHRSGTTDRETGGTKAPGTYRQTSPPRQLPTRLGTRTLHCDVPRSASDQRRSMAGWATEAPGSQVTFGVLGPVAAWGADGAALDLKGPRHRAVLARLAVARGRVVPLGALIEDLWETPPAGAARAIRTFVGALRRAIEPGRSARTGFQFLVTRDPGYALRAGPDDLDALTFERLATEAASVPAARVLDLSDEALALWRGPAYAEFADEPWAVAERARLAELRLGLIERQAAARLALGLVAQAVPDLQAHVSGHPWREEAWRLLALALYRSGRQAEALDVIRRARSLLATELGLDPGPALAALEAGILRQAAQLDAPADDVLAVDGGRVRSRSPPVSPGPASSQPPRSPAVSR